MYFLFNKLDKEKELTDRQISFLINFTNENLNHARHVENERLTFNSIYMAMVGGALAFVYDLYEDDIALIIIALLIVLGAINILLTLRWQNVFDEHIQYAKQAYYLLQRETFGEDLEIPQNLEDSSLAAKIYEKLNDKTNSIYCFSPKRKMRMISTRSLFVFFNVLILAVLIATLFSLSTGVVYD